MKKLYLYKTHNQHNQILVFFNRKDFTTWANQSLNLVPSQYLRNLLVISQDSVSAYASLFPIVFESKEIK